MTGRPNELLDRLLHAATLGQLLHAAPAPEWLAENKLILDSAEAQVLYDYIRWLESEEWLAEEEKL
jgi:hypothetical protein